MGVFKAPDMNFGGTRSVHGDAICHAPRAQSRAEKVGEIWSAPGRDVAGEYFIEMRNMVAIPFCTLIWLQLA